MTRFGMYDFHSNGKAVTRARDTFTLFLMLIISCHGYSCSRQHSRTARQILEEHFYKHYIEGAVDVPVSCPLLPARDMYLGNENHKSQETISKWSCHYCGKAFMTEQTLDVHFDNRHSDQVLQGPNAVCLADYCDYLRCDIVSGARKPGYWDKALCKESDVAVLKEKCETMVKVCAPLSLIGTERYDFQRVVRESLCSSLTCDKFWEVPLKQGSAFGMTAYVIAVVLLFTGLIVYYFIVYSHFYTEHSLLDESDGLLKMNKQSQPYIREPDAHEIRQRTAYSVDR
ncbi:uncharacterized protein [Ptychodera flava]|uniref:uncharacterized protein isoform X2 n=1 Tax=Ptychodera flava TaxID=63121 RepID=UPI00396A61A0